MATSPNYHHAAENRLRPGFRVLQRPSSAAVNEQLRAHNFEWDASQRRLVRKGLRAAAKKGGR